MSHDTPAQAPESQAAPPLPAGDFSAWLREARRSLVLDTGAEVACGDCNACCRSSYFIHIRPNETTVLEKIPKTLRVTAPGLPKGNVLLGYDKEGRCPMLTQAGCSIYADRPQTCRDYDCRLFAAAGLDAGDDKPLINQRVSRWRFSYPSARDRAEHEAVRATAAFLRAKPEHFPGGKIPGSPSQQAIIALKAYGVFLQSDGKASRASRAASPQEIADAIVEACRRFDDSHGRR
jgi:hypothetical protein